MKTLVLLGSHAFVLLIGFAAGIYALSILTAPDAPTAADLELPVHEVLFETEFRRDLADSDFLHWGEGRVVITRERVALMGSLSPGPDFRLYFAPQFVETEADFLRLKPTMREAGPVRTFDNFSVDLPADLDPAAYNSVIVWCESFSQFITAARYR